MLSPRTRQAARDLAAEAHRQAEEAKVRADQAALHRDLAIVVCLILIPELLLALWLVLR